MIVFCNNLLNEILNFGIIESIRFICFGKKKKSTKLKHPSRRISTEQAMKICCRLVEFFSLLHTKHKISHGDLKLDNIMIDRETGNPIVIDWGAARWDEDTEGVSAKTVRRILNF